jgi:hypothetical protein
VADGSCRKEPKGAREVPFHQYDRGPKSHLLREGKGLKKLGNNNSHAVWRPLVWARASDPGVCATVVTCTGFHPTSVSPTLHSRKCRRGFWAPLPRQRISMPSSTRMAPPRASSWRCRRLPHTGFRQTCGDRCGRCCLGCTRQAPL